MLILRKPWTIQPPHNPQINWEDPITSGLVGFVWMGYGKPRDLLATRMEMLTAGTTIQPAQAGIASIVGTAANSGVFTARDSYPTWKLSSTPITFAAYFNHTTPAGSRVLTGATDSSLGYALWDTFGTRARLARVRIGASARDVTGGNWSTGLTVRGLTATETTLRGYDNGVQFGSTTYAASAITYENTFGRLYFLGSAEHSSSAGEGYWMALWNRALTPDEMLRLAKEPWCMLEPLEVRVPVSVASGAATHGTSGALVGDASVIAGTAARIAVHGTIGVLAGAGAATAGAAARTREHATTGAAAGSGGVIAGTAAHLALHATSGTLAGAGAVTAGTAARATSAFEHATSGDLVGAGATIAGTAARVHVFSTAGALAGAGGVVAGTAAHVAIHGTSGVLAGGGGQLSGTAAGSGAAEAIGLAGGFDVDIEPILWWQRKPKRIKPEEAKQALKAVAKVVKEKAEEHAAEREPVAQRRADVKQAVAPLVSQMPGFDWRPIYDEAYDRALTAAIAQQMREREAQAAQHAAALARQIDDDEVALLAAML